MMVLIHQSGNHWQHCSAHTLTFQLTISPQHSCFTAYVTPHFQSWCHALTCTYILSLCVPPARFTALTGLVSDLAAILILSSYVPLCAYSLTFLFWTDIFPRVRFILSLTPHDSSPLLCVCVTHFLSVYPNLFCHVIFILLRTYVSISTTLTCIFTYL